MRTLYHATAARNLPPIQKSGLTPGGSYGRTYLLTDPESAHTYAEEAHELFFNPARSWATLKVILPANAALYKDNIGPENSFYADVLIPPENITVHERFEL